MIEMEKLLAAVQDIAARNPTYRTGGTGKDGTCDCVGLIMGAMYRLGHAKYPLHSSNYFARFEMTDFGPITSEYDLYPGMIVYKGRADSGQLNERYRPGGQYYGGSPLDYYHVGVVTSTEPLCITHCTSTSGVDGIARDNSIGSWAYGGRLKDVCYDDDQGGDTMQVIAKGTVIAPAGSTVNLRKTPNRASALERKVPVGTRVDVWEEASGWCHIQTSDGSVGYMMSEFVCKDEPKENHVEIGSDDEYVALRIRKSVALEIAQALVEIGG